MAANKALGDLRILPISCLKPHEETTPEKTERIKRIIRNSKIAKNPVLVDRESLVVLDGMHRVAAFKELGYKCILCQLVDYESQKLLVGLWHPFFPKELVPGLEKLATLSSTNYEDGMQAICASRAVFLLARPEAGKIAWSLAGLSENEIPLAELVSSQKKILSALRKKCELKPVPDFEAKEFAEKGAVLIRRPFRKQEILSLASNGILLPPTSTRHMFPLRVIGVSIPLSWLKLKPEDANKRLGKMLDEAVKKGEIRHYPEPVLVVDDAREKPLI